MKNPVCPICKTKMRAVKIKHFEIPESDNWEEVFWECECKPSDWGMEIDTTISNRDNYGRVPFKKKDG